MQLLNDCTIVGKFRLQAHIGTANHSVKEQHDTFLWP